MTIVNITGQLAKCGDVLVHPVNTFVRIGITGIDASSLSGKKMPYTLNEDTRLRAIAYNVITKAFVEAYPQGDAVKLQKVLSNYDTSDVVRVAEAIARFGIKSLLENIID